MAHRTSSRLLFTAFGVSLLAGAGQLGLAFGFGIVRLTGTFTGASINQWPAQLVWVGWFAMNAAVIGAMLTERLVRHGGQLTGTPRQLAVAGGAALGATVVAPLCMQPARNAELISVDPVWAVAICAVLGAVVGAGAAVAVLVRPPLAWNMAAVAAVVWLLALLSVLPSLGASGPLTPVRLGVLEPTWLAAGTAQQLALLILPMVTLLAGAATAAVARWRGHPPLVSGPSGVAGPVLVAFAYLAAGPGDAGDRYQLTPYYGALIAVLVGALGSAAAALLPWTLPDRFSHRAATPASRTTAESTVIEPTAILQPLPATPALPPSTSAPTDTSATPVVVDSDTEAARPTGDARAAASDGSPPHWHWPVAHTDPTAAAATPTASDADTRSQVAAVTAPPPAAATPPPAAPPVAVGRTDSGQPGNDVRSVDNDATTDNHEQVDDGAEGDRADDGTEHADEPVRRTDATDRSPDEEGPHRGEGPREPAGPQFGGQPAAGTDGKPDAAVDPTPVGDGSDLPRPTPVTMEPEAPVAPTGKTPTPRRTRGPRTPTPAAVPPPATPATPAVPDTPTVEPAPAVDAGGGEAEEVSPEATPRPRQRFALPELGRATAGPDTSAAPGIAAAVPETPEVSIETAATARDLSAAFTKPPAVRAEDVQPDGEPEKGRRGLFRRGRPRSGEDATTEHDEPLAAQDEEYVDWVAGLSRPLDDDETTPPKEPRRSLRSTGRHHRR
ncbi:hypothetical protein [Micromonospora lutea]|uniref:Uncharacterized protein n=1 Tax=Micromonospora lutea TaxID=419825 RepID=A0ABQ4IUQ6_9ACTN|nr:hypothetical protein [Micromonospora lutea]GIJ21501.1 hypothetical protein Vlu01_21250 [Micromonospora lutea]